MVFGFLSHNDEYQIIATLTEVKSEVFLNSLLSFVHFTDLYSVRTYSPSLSSVVTSGTDIADQ